MQRSIIAFGFAAAVAAAAPAAHAQKSKDTVRMAFLEATQMIDRYLDSKPENEFLANAIFDNLLAYDENEHHYAPGLSKSWKRIDDRTYEFELRDDVKWHDGHAFSADDVVYTLNWLNDPNTKLRFKANWNFIEKVEKTGPYSLRIVTREPTPSALQSLAYDTSILPEHLHKPLEDKAQFGTKPVGTGMYKAVQVDRNQGVVMLKNADYKHGGAARPASNIGRFEVVPIPDVGTQMAQFLVGSVNLLRNAPLEQAEQLAKDPKYTMTLAQSLSYVYMSFDAAGRSGVKVVQDPRVRRAMMMAVNHADVYKLRTGSYALPRGDLDALCWKFQEGCGYTLTAPAYDPEGAKKLLAEAGYPNGFDLDLTALDSVRDMTEVVAGQLRKIGIRASVDALTFVAFAKKQQDGRQTATVSAWSAGSGPDVYRTINYYIDDGVRDYFHDDELKRLAKLGLTTMDDKERRGYVTQLMDRMTSQAYAIPVAPIPLVFLHSSDIKLTLGRYSSYGIMPFDVNWK